MICSPLSVLYILLYVTFTCSLKLNNNIDVRKLVSDDFRTLKLNYMIASTVFANVLVPQSYLNNNNHHQINHFKYHSLTATTKTTSSTAISNSYITATDNSKLPASFSQPQQQLQQSFKFPTVLIPMAHADYSLDYSRVSSSPTDSLTEPDESNMEIFRLINTNDNNNKNNNNNNNNLDTNNNLNTNNNNNNMNNYINEKLAYRPFKNTNLDISREIVLTLKAYLDETERDLFSKKWESVLVYLNTFSQQEEAFFDISDNLFPAVDDNVETAAREALQYEARTMFMTLDTLREAVKDHMSSVAEKYYAKLLLSYDRFLKAGDLYPTYDVITSTEIFFKNTDLTTLRFDEKSEVRNKDEIILKLGPDMGKKGRIIYIDGHKYAVIKLDKDGRDYQEVKYVPLSILAKSTDDLPTIIRKKLNL